MRSSERVTWPFARRLCRFGRLRRQVSQFNDMLFADGDINRRCSIPAGKSTICERVRRICILIATKFRGGACRLSPVVCHINDKRNRAAEPTQHPCHHGRRYRLGESGFLPPGPDVGRDAEPRQIGCGWDAVHRLLRGGQLHSVAQRVVPTPSLANCRSGPDSPPRVRPVPHWACPSRHRPSRPQ